MLERDDIKIVLEMAIDKIENEKIIESIQALANTYTTTNINYNNIQTQNKNVKKICQSETWKEFSSSQINFLKSYDIYNYLGEANHTLLSGLTHDNYGDNNKIKTLLIAHAVSTTERLRSCKSLLNVIEAGHFIENKDFNIEKYLEKADLDIALEGVDTILATLKERLDLTEAEITELRERMEELKEDLKNKSPKRWKKVAEFSIHTAVAECIKDPAKVKHALEFLGFIQNSTIQGLSVMEQLGLV